MAKMVRTVSDFAAARTVQEDLLERARELGYSAETAFAIRLAFEEAVNNAIRHGNAMDAAKAVRIEYEVTPARVAIAIADEGRGLRPRRPARPHLRREPRKARRTRRHAHAGLYGQGNL